MKQKIIILLIVLTFFSFAEKTNATVLINRTGTGSTFVSAGSGSTNALYACNTGTAVISPTICNGSDWGIPITSGEVYYLQTKEPTAGTCADITATLLNNSSVLGSSTGTLIGYNCNFNITANITNNLTGIRFQSTSSNFTLTGDNNSSFSTYVRSVTASQIGTPSFTLSDSGVTSFLTINTPDDLETLSDFSQWNITYAGYGTGLKQFGMHYSEDLSILEDCEEFPWGITAGYTECINGDPNISTDYGIATTVETGTMNINKSQGLTMGKTYYAQAIIQENNANGINIAVSDIISFTIGVPADDALVLAECTTLNIFCHLKNALIWGFSISDNTITQFSQLTLENAVPFSYIYDLDDLYAELFATTNQTFDITIPFLNGGLQLLSTDQLFDIPFMSLVQTILGAMMYFFTAFTIYHKLLKVHSNQ